MGQRGTRKWQRNRETRRDLGRGHFKIFPKVTEKPTTHRTHTEQTHTHNIYGTHRHLHTTHTPTMHRTHTSHKQHSNRRTTPQHTYVHTTHQPHIQHVYTTYTALTLRRHHTTTPGTPHTHSTEHIWTAAYNTHVHMQNVHSTHCMHLCLTYYTPRIHHTRSMHVPHRGTHAVYKTFKEHIHMPPRKIAPKLNPVPSPHLPAPEASSQVPKSCWSLPSLTVSTRGESGRSSRSQSRTPVGPHQGPGGLNDCTHTSLAETLRLKLQSPRTLE